MSGSGIWTWPGLFGPSVWDPKDPKEVLLRGVGESRPPGLVSDFICNGDFVVPKKAYQPTLAVTNGKAGFEGFHLRELAELKQHGALLSPLCIYLPI